MLFIDLVYFEKRMPDTSETNATRVRHDCDMREAGATQMGLDCDKNGKIATQVKNFDFDYKTSENIFSHPIFARWKMEDGKERINFILRHTFWKCFIPMPKCI